MNIRIKMEKLINLLRERKPNFDENHILDYMYSQWTIFIKDWKPVYAYDEDIFPNTELMIISKKEWFIKRLVENDKINREKFWNSETKTSKYSDFELSYDTPREDYTNILLMELSIQDDPIKFICEILQ